MKRACQNCWYVWKGFVTRIIITKYEIPMLCNYEIMATFKFLHKQVKGQGHQIKTVGMCEKILSQAMHISNMKALSETQKEVKEKEEEKN